MACATAATGAQCEPGMPPARSSTRSQRRALRHSIGTFNAWAIHQAISLAIKTGL